MFDALSPGVFSLVGGRIEVLFPLENRWMPATVTGFNGQERMFMVAYDDGKEEKISLNEETWRLAPENAGLPPLDTAAAQGSEGEYEDPGGMQEEAREEDQGQGGQEAMPEMPPLFGREGLNGLGPPPGSSLNYIAAPLPRLPSQPLALPATAAAAASGQGAPLRDSPTQTKARERGNSSSAAAKQVKYDDAFIQKVAADYEKLKNDPNREQVCGARNPAQVIGERHGVSEWTVYRHYKKAVTDGMIDKTETGQKRWRATGGGAPSTPFNFAGPLGLGPLTGLGAFGGMGQGSIGLPPIGPTALGKRPGDLALLGGAPLNKINICEQAQGPNVRISQLAGGLYDGFSITVSHVDEPPGYELRCQLPGVRSSDDVSVRCHSNGQLLLVIDPKEQEAQPLPPLPGSADQDRAAGGLSTSQQAAQALQARSAPGSAAAAAAAADPMLRLGEPGSGGDLGPPMGDGRPNMDGGAGPCAGFESGVGSAGPKAGASTPDRSGDAGAGAAGPSSALQGPAPGASQSAGGGVSSDSPPTLGLPPVVAPASQQPPQHATAAATQAPPPVALEPESEDIPGPAPGSSLLVPALGPLNSIPRLDGEFGARGAAEFLGLGRTSSAAAAAAAAGQFFGPSSSAARPQTMDTAPWAPGSMIGSGSPIRANGLSAFHVLGAGDTSASLAGLAARGQTSASPAALQAPAALATPAPAAAAAPGPVPTVPSPFPVKKLIQFPTKILAHTASAMVTPAGSFYLRVNRDIPVPETQALGQGFNPMGPFQ